MRTPRPQASPTFPTGHGVDMNRRTVVKSLLGAMGALAVSRPRDLTGESLAPTRTPLPPVEPFEIAFDPDLIADLQRRLDAVRWPEIPFETGWSAGTDDAVLRELVRYWREEYDWFGVQERMNRLDHYRIPIEGDRLHYVHYRAANGGPSFPILLLHGWPSSFWEFNRAAPLLASGAGGARAFDVIVPSLPGF